MLGLLLSSILAALLSASVYVWFVWWLDRYEKEPWWLLVLVFTWGAFGATTLSIIISLLLEIPISAIFTGLTYELAGASVIAPIVEEATKALPLVVIILFIRREVDSVLDGIVYGAMAGLGFALIENILYFVGTLEGGAAVLLFTFFFRSVVFGLNHAFYTALTGAGLAYTRFTKNPAARFLAPVFGFGGAIFFHAVHNLGATLAAANCLSILISLTFGYGGLLIMAIGIILIWRQEGRWIETYLRPEIGALITEEQFKIIRSPFMRFMHGLQLFFAGSEARRQRSVWAKLGHAGTELAFKKHQLTLQPDDPKGEAQVEALSREVAALRTQLLGADS